MIKRFLRNLLTEPARKQSAAGNQLTDTDTAAEKARSANPIKDLKRKVGASERVDEDVRELRIEEGIRAALDRPDIPLTAERLILINQAMDHRAKILERIPASSRKRLSDALARHLAQGKE